MSEPDFYAVLGVAPDADARGIRAAYRKAAREHHPDRGGSAEQFHQIQAAWDVLGTEEARADYDRRRRNGTSAQSPDSADPTEEGAGFTYSRSNRTSGRSGAGRSGTRTQQNRGRRSPQADQPPVYAPPLSESEPLNLTLTSQKVHGEFAARGVWGGGKAQRRQLRTVELLEKHVLSALPAARLFNDVLLAPLEQDRKGRPRAPRHADRAEHVLICGTTAVLVSALEIPAAAASWDGHSLRASGRRIQLPNLAAQAKKLRAVLRVTDAPVPTLIEHQVVLLAADGDLFHPVVEPVGAAARQGSQPLAAGRAIGHIANVLGGSEHANLVDRRLMAALRTQLASSESA